MSVSNKWGGHHTPQHTIGWGSFFFKFKKRNVPTPGIEPGPRRWERRILTTRPYGSYERQDKRITLYCCQHTTLKRNPYCSVGNTDLQFPKLVGFQGFAFGSQKKSESNLPHQALPAVPQAAVESYTRFPKRVHNSGGYSIKGKLRTWVARLVRRWKYLTPGSHKISCRDSCAKYINGNQGDIQGYFNASLIVNWPEDLSSFHSLMCKNNVLLDYLLWSLANIHSHACFTLADPTPRFASDVVGGKLGRHNVHRAICDVTMDWPWNGIAATHREILWRKTTRYITVQLATGSLHDNAKMLLVSTIGCLPAKKRGEAIHYNTQQIEVGQK